VILERTERFRRAAKRLDRTDRDRLAQALARLVSDPRHPPLRVKRIQGTAGVWEARASDELRITFEMIDGVLLLRNVGGHDATLRSP
jgi:mRNA-degrading endonuclease RelE of RelBE toxin-antitoxin system